MPEFHTLRREQWIPQPVAQVFDFFADAGNLEAITPPWLAFRILTPRPIPMAAGTEIRYRLRWHGAPLVWRTEIRSWDPPTRFVDIQLNGPYRLWHHTHLFEPRDGGTRMRDIVRYRLPFGFVGKAMQIVKVERDLEQIFDYRARRVREIFASLQVEVK